MSKTKAKEYEYADLIRDLKLIQKLEDTYEELYQRGFDLETAVILDRLSLLYKDIADYANIMSIASKAKANCLRAGAAPPTPEGTRAVVTSPLQIKVGA